MSKKSFKIARKPGQGNGAQSIAATTPPETKARTLRAAPAQISSTTVGVGPTTRKTIEVPEDYFRRVKIRAVERGILEKELWAEVLQEYFATHPKP
jgi:hypothetical protein